MRLEDLPNEVLEQIARYLKNTLAFKSMSNRFASIRVKNYLMINMCDDLAQLEISGQYETISILNVRSTSVVLTNVGTLSCKKLIVDSYSYYMVSRIRSEEIEFYAIDDTHCYIIPYIRSICLKLTCHGVNMRIHASKIHLQWIENNTNLRVKIYDSIVYLVSPK